MGAIEETRQVPQDFLAPELRAIAARLEALAERVDALDRGVSARIDAVERNAEARHQAVLIAIGNLTNYSALAERVARIEAERKAS